MGVYSLSEFGFQHIPILGEEIRRMESGCFLC